MPSVIILINIHHEQIATKLVHGWNRMFNRETVHRGIINASIFLIRCKIVLYGSFLLIVKLNIPSL